MGGCTRFTKEQLLGKLDEMIPGLIAKLPAPEEFDFKETGRQNEYMLKIGSDNTSQGVRSLWVTQNSQVKPHLGYKRRDGVPAGINSNHWFQGNDDFFGKMSVSGQLLPYSHEMKAMVAFVYVYCDKQAEFYDFAHGGASKLLVQWLNFYTGNQHEFSIIGFDGISLMRVKRIPEITRSQEDGFSGQGYEDVDGEYTEVSDMDTVEDYPNEDDEQCNEYIQQPLSDVEDSADEKYEDTASLDDRTQQATSSAEQIPMLRLSIRNPLDRKVPVPSLVVKLKVHRQSLHELSDKTHAPSKTTKERKLGDEYDGNFSAPKQLRIRLKAYHE